MVLVPRAAGCAVSASRLRDQAPEAQGTHRSATESHGEVRPLLARQTRTSFRLERCTNASRRIVHSGYEDRGSVGSAVAAGVGGAIAFEMRSTIA